MHHRRTWRWSGSTDEAATLEPTVTGLAGDVRADQIGVWRHDVEQRLVTEGLKPERAALQASLIKATFTGLVMDLFATGDTRRLNKALDSWLDKLNADLSASKGDGPAVEEQAARSNCGRPFATCTPGVPGSPRAAPLRRDTCTGWQDSGVPTVDPKFLSQIRYRCIGPTRGGRVVAVAADPKDQSVVLLRGCAGGVWKTTTPARIGRMSRTASSTPPPSARWPSRTPTAT